MLTGQALRHSFSYSNVLAGQELTQVLGLATLFTFLVPLHLLQILFVGQSRQLSIDEH